MTILPVALPRLNGIWLWLYRLAFGALLALAIFSAGATTWFDTRNTSISTPQINEGFDD